MPEFIFTTHDGYPSEESAIVDAGLGESNGSAAPLHEVQAISCFARTENGQVIGGAIGRRWGNCCELQQLWVAPSHRRQGVGTQLVRQFEAQGIQSGCNYFYLETFSFQAPSLYRSLGYIVEYEHTCYPHGIARILMAKNCAGGATPPLPLDGQRPV